MKLPKKILIIFLACSLGISSTSQAAFWSQWSEQTRITVVSVGLTALCSIVLGSYLYWYMTYTQKGVSANTHNKNHDNKNTPLHEACQSNDLEKVKTAFQNKPSDINAQNSTEQTPLHIACEKGSLPIAKYLVTNGAQVNATDKIAATPFHNSCYSSSLEITKYLAEQGADVNAKTSAHNTPLHIACNNNNKNLAEYLINLKNILVNETNREGETPLHHAIRYRSLINIIQYIAQHKTDLNKQNANGNTPLHMAYWYNNQEAIKILLKHKALTTIKNNEGKTPAENSQNF